MATGIDEDGDSDSVRVPMQAKLTARARAGWDRCSRENGVTVTALLEVIGQWAADGIDVVDDETHAAAIDAARRLDFERKRSRYTR